MESWTKSISQIGQMGLKSHHLAMFLVREYITGMDTLSNSQNPNTDSLICEIRAIMIERDKGSP